MWTRFPMSMLLARLSFAKKGCDNKRKKIAPDTMKKAVTQVPMIPECIIVH